MTCDHCGDDIDPANPGQVTADTALCLSCTREAEKWGAIGDIADHAVRHIPSVSLVTEPDHIIDGPPGDVAEDAEEPADDDATPIDPNRDLGDPVGEYDDARNLNAAETMAEIRRMS